MRVSSLKLVAISMFVVVLFLYAASIFWYNYNTVDNAFKDLNKKQVELTVANIKPMLETQLTYNLDSFIPNQLEQIVSNNEYISKIDIQLENKIIASSNLKEAIQQPIIYPMSVGIQEYKIILFPSESINSGAYEYYLDESLKMIAVVVGLVTLAILFYTFIISMYDKQREKDYKSMQDKMEEEVADNEKKTNIMYQQSRLAQMGEMISNIAHQWRQPLNSIALVLQNIKLSNAMGNMSKEEFEEATNKIENSLQYMSNTITDFRNFYKTNKEKETFTLEEAVHQGVSIVQNALEDKAIKVNIDAKDASQILGFKNELTQVIVNILQNSKDAIIKNDIKEPAIDITISKESSYGVLNIEDNAGGIAKELLPKIFDPYFTTKHKDQGTGLGLYMSQVIIRDNFEGKLEVSNTNDGAKFTIKIKTNKG